MRLEDRKLSIRMEPRTGADVKRLIRELVQLGYHINEPEQRASIFGDTTHEAVAQFQREHDLPATGEVDERTAARINAAVDERRPPERERPFLVSGIVTRLGQPIAGVRVDAVDQDLRSAEGLGFAITDASGRYEIRYGPDQFSRLEKGAADIVLALTTSTDVRIARFTARDADGKVITLPPTTPPRDGRIDVEIEDTTLDLSLYERLVAELGPLLGDVRVPDADAANPIARLAELTAAEIEFLAREAELPVQEVSVLATAARAERAARARQRGVPAAAFYALLRQGLSIEPAGVLREGRRGLSEALRDAIDGGIVPRSLNGALESILADLEELAFAAPAGSDGAGLRIDARLSETLTDETRRRSFLRLAADETRPPSEFWAALARQPGFEDPAVRERLAIDLQFARVTLNHAPLAAALRARPGVRGIRDLVGLSEEQWVALLQEPGLDGQPIGPPPSLAGATLVERARTYSQAITGALTRAYPNDAVATIVNDPATRIAPELRAPVASFLRSADGFDIRHGDLDGYLKEYPEAIQGVAADLREKIKAEVKRGQRLLSLTSDPLELSKLLSTGISSAYEVASQDKAHFTGKHGDVLGTATAHAVHEKATQITNANFWLLNGLKPQNVLTDPVLLGDGSAAAAPGYAAGAPADLAAELPNVAKLFGANDACGCEHCRSIYSPAAYLVTLLQFLEHCAPNADGRTPYDVLVARRPDIPALKLTCANTDTPMPLIDRVNEILEAFVAAGALSAADAHDTGAATAAALAAAPQFTNAFAYDKLREARYANVLPYDDAWQDVSAHLTQLTASRSGIMELFGRGGAPTPVDLAGERLGIPPAELPILTDAGVSPAALLYPPGEEPADVVAAMTPAREFLRRVGLTYERATDVLGCRFVDPEGEVEFRTSPDDADPCNINHKIVAGLDAAALRRLLRLLRLQRRTGWPVDELDRCLAAVSATEIDDASLIALDQIARLAALLDRPRVEVLPLWSPLPAGGDTSLLAELLELEVRDVTALKQLSGAGSFTSPAQVLGFAELAREVKAAGTTVAALSELIRAIPAAPSEPATYPLIGKLRAGLPRLEAIGRAGTAEQRVREFLAAVLTPDRDSNAVEKITGVAVLQAPLAALPAGLALPEGLASRIGFDAEAGMLRVTGMLTAAEVAAARAASADAPYHAALDLIVSESENKVKGALAGLADDAAVTALLAASSFTQKGTVSEAAVESKLAGLLENIAPRAHALLVDRLIERTASDELRLNIATIRLLADPIAPGVFADLRAVFDAQLPSNDALIPAETLEQAQLAERRLRRLAALIASLDLTPRALKALWDLRADFGGLDLLLNPIDRGDAAAVDASAHSRLAQWRQLQAFARAQESRRGLVDAVDVMTSATLDDAVQRLAFLDQRDPALVGAIVGPPGLNLTLGQLRTVTMLERVRRAAGLAVRLGAQPELLFRLATQAPDPAAADGVRAVARAAYNEETWTTVSSAAQAILRVVRRDALLGYLKPRLRLATDYDCLRHFLVDVETGVEPSTSRTKEALSAIQHYVPLCLRGEIEGVSPSAIDAERWATSLCYYRVREAALQVFFNTGEFIEEDLRDDQSEFFRELESHLRQGEPTEGRVEEAIRGYLSKLEAIARPQILAMCEDPARGRLHLFARTTSEPPIYYQRWRERSGIWSGWSTLPFDLASNQLIPVIWASRLFLFWPIAEEGRTKDPSTKEPVLRIRLAWSTLRGEQWETKRTMPREIALELSDYELQDLTFNAAELGNGSLRIECAYSEGLAGMSSKGVVENVTRLGLFEALDPISPIRVTPLNQWKTHVSDTRFFSFLTGAGHLRAQQLGSVGQESYLLERTSGPATVTSLRDPADVRVGEPFALSDDTATFLGIASSAADPGTAYVTPEQVRPFSEYGPKQAVDSASPTTVLMPIEGAISTRSWGAVALTQPATPAFEPMPRRMTTAGVGSIQLAIGIPPGGSPVAPEPPLSFGAIQTATVSGVPSNEWTGQGDATAITPTNLALTIGLEPHYHPFAHEFARALDAGGPNALFTTANQRLGDPPDAGHALLHFTAAYQPGFVKLPYPRRDVDFTPTGAYTLYNREIFFHIPALVLELATREGKLELAEQYGKYVLDETPRTTEPTPQRFWNFLPFKTAPRERIDRLLQALRASPGDPRRDAFLAQIADWSQHPFQPHRIARARPVAYMHYFFYKHLEHRIAKGDRPYRRDTLESINEASQIYLAAAESARPVGADVPAREPTQPETYASLRGKQIDMFGNALVELESKSPAAAGGSAGGGGTPGDASTSLLDLSAGFYFCTPKSHKLASYWRTLQSRLFNIRHGRDIDGVPQSLPLFEPPIDPMLLVRAAAQGLGLAQALDELFSPPPNVRYRYAQEQARALASQAMSFRQALIQAEERHDGEELTALLATQQAETLKAIRLAKAKAVDSVQAEVQALRQSLRPVQREFEYYRDIEKITPHEKTQLRHLDGANQLQLAAAGLEVDGQLVNLVPTVHTGTMSGTSTGGLNIGAMYFAMARAVSLFASDQTFRATKAGILGALSRTQGEWALRRDVAQLQIAHIERQITAREIQMAVAQVELDAHEQQIEHAQVLLAFHRDKHTAAELYGRLAGEARHVLGRVYQLARTWAKWAGQAAEAEHGTLRRTFDFPRLDDGRLDTLAPERLLVELGELDRAFHETKAYDYRLVKHLSLLLHDPLALIALKETGVCEFELPETLYDADYPGHYDRRIHSVTVTIPCVVGPYVGINATLTLLWSKTRTSANPGDTYAEGKDDPRFVHRFVARRAIALSTGQSDDGMPQLTFAEDRQEGYGPLENAGAISRFRFELYRDCNAWDVDNMTDVILGLTIVSREGGALLREKARAAVVTATPQKGLVRLFSLKHEFPNAWHLLTAPPSAGIAEQGVELTLDQDRFPVRLRDRALKTTQIEVFLDFKKPSSNAVYATGGPLTLNISASGGAPKALDLKSTIAVLGGMPCGRVDIAQKLPSALRLAIAPASLAAMAPELRSAGPDPGSPPRLNRDRLNDILLLVRFNAD